MATRYVFGSTVHNFRCSRQALVFVFFEMHVFVLYYLSIFTVLRIVKITCKYYNFLLVIYCLFLIVKDIEHRQSESPVRAEGIKSRWK